MNHRLLAIGLSLIWAACAATPGFAAEADPNAQGWSVLRDAAEFRNAGEEADRLIASGWSAPSGDLAALLRTRKPLIERARAVDWEAFFSAEAPPSPEADPRDRVFRESRNLARFLLLDARRLQYAGKTAEAEADALAVRRLSKAIGRRLNLISYGTSLKLSTMLAPIARELALRDPAPCPGKMSDYLRVEGGRTADTIAQSMIEYEAPTPRAAEFVRKAAEKSAELVRHYFERLAEAADDPSSGEMDAVLKEIDDWRKKLDKRFKKYESAEDLIADYAANPENFDEEEVTATIARLFVSIAVPNVRGMAKMAQNCADAYRGVK